MGSDAYYRVWLHQGGGSWYQVNRFQSLKWGIGYSSPDQFSAQVYVKNDPTLSALLTPSRPFRITKLDSTDGTDGTAILTGTLYMPSKEDLTAPEGAEPIVQNIRGFGFEMEINEMLYNPEKVDHPNDPATPPAQITPTLSTISVGRAASILVSGVNTRLHGDPASTFSVFGHSDPSNAQAPTSDPAVIDSTNGGNFLGDSGGQNVQLKFKGDSLYEALLDIAMLGDVDTQYPYQVVIDSVEGHADGEYEFTPRVNFLSPVNESYVFPNGITGVYSASPLDGSAMHSNYTLASGANDPAVISYPDSRRVLEFKEYIDIRTEDEKDRLRNAVSIFYQGMATGNTEESGGQQESPRFTNAASISAFGEREFNDFYPFVQGGDSAQTASRFVKTMLNTYKGHSRYLGYNSAVSATNVATGIRRGIVELKTGEVYSTTFNANIGETVSVLRRDGTEAITDKLIGYFYDQDTTSLIAQIGIPAYEQGSQLQRDSRRLKRQMSLMEVTEFRGGANITFGTPPGTTPTLSFNRTLSHTNRDEVFIVGDPTPVPFTPTLPGNAGPYHSVFSVSIDSATIASDGKSDWWFGHPLSGAIGTAAYGPFTFRVKYGPSEAQSRYIHEFTVDKFDGVFPEPVVRDAVVYPFSFSSVAGEVDYVRVEVDGRNRINSLPFTDSYQNIDFNFTLEVRPASGAADISHVHYL